MPPTVIITGNALAIDGTVPVAMIDISLTNYGNTVPSISGVGVLFGTSVRINPNQTTGAWTVNLYQNNLIDPGHASNPTQTYYQYDFKDANGNVIASYFFQHKSAGTFDFTTLTPYTP